MINIILPNDDVIQFDKPITGIDIAKKISLSLAKEAFLIKINDEIKDLHTIINKDAKISIIKISDKAALDVLRHDVAHLTADAVKSLFPEVQVTIGPSIDDGFYYDFAKDEPFTLLDLENIEAKMHQIAKEDKMIVREVWDKQKAIDFFKSIGELYKAEIIEHIDKDQEITLYRQGDFVDLCKGPHGPSTGKLKHFKLTKLAGAYWRGDSNNPMLQRIYGTAWPTKAQLDEYLYMIEEAQKRDHRKIGKELDLFHFQAEAQGMVFWHNHGFTIYRIIEKYIRNKLKQSGYIEVKTPIMANKSLWEKSGHWSKFRENMFALNDNEEEILAIKPMNCPLHVEIFNQGIKSYKELPLRMSEFGLCHRNEASGALHGLMRVRSLVQDDAHIFCAEDQITSETIAFCNLLKQIYNDFGFTKIAIKFADRPEIRAGTDDVWDKSEKALKDAVDQFGLNYEISHGEGAFYGPKLEFHLKDALGRSWQCGTLQVDFVLPERLNAQYIAKNGSKQRPVMLHRAIIGTFERFIGILIEEYAGKFPLWLAPLQIGIATIVNDCDDYAMSIYNNLIKKDIRCNIDISSEKVNYKIKRYMQKKVPLLVIIGKNEVQNNLISLRKFGSNETTSCTLDQLIDLVQEQNTLYLS
ncbi:MAG: threonine--tRNA ligase [Rickettsiaceae bacterium]